MTPAIVNAVSTLMLSAVWNFSAVISGSWIRNVATPKSRNIASTEVSAAPMEYRPISRGVSRRARTIADAAEMTKAEYFSPNESSSARFAESIECPYLVLPGLTTSWWAKARHPRLFLHAVKQSRG